MIKNQILFFFLLTCAKTVLVTPLKDFRIRLRRERSAMESYDRNASEKIMKIPFLNILTEDVVNVPEIFILFSILSTNVPFERSRPVSKRNRPPDTMQTSDNDPMFVSGARVID